MVNELKILSIAGHDPSGGAGISADIKTFMHFGLQDLSICTALTLQNESEFHKVSWVDQQAIEDQLELLCSSYSIAVVKIGLIQSIAHLHQTVKLIQELSPKSKIIWDPILSASAGFVFHEAQDAEELLSCMSKIHWITPNLPEKEILERWCGSEMEKWPVENVALKGGHGIGSILVDQLWINGKLTKEIRKVKLDKSIHGSGCIYSSALGAALGKGKSSEEAFAEAHEYVNRLLQHTQSRLAPQFAVL